MTLIIARQAAEQTQLPSTSTHYDHRWLLFLIPICLLFIALIFTVWYLIRRRKKQRQRRSVLRNRALVIAEQERQRGREEKRLSRGNSLSSKLSRMTSVKSSTTRSYKTRSNRMTSQSKSGEGNATQTSDCTQRHIINSGEDADQREGVFNKSEGNIDVELMAESEITLPVTVISPETSSRVRIVEDARPCRVKRKEVGISGDVAMQGEKEIIYSGWTIDRQDSQRSIGGVPSSLSHGTNGSNPFASPSSSSAGHELLAPEAATEVNSNEGGILSRTLSGMGRLRQPSPIAGSRNLQRSESRASRKSSIRSTTRRADFQLPTSVSATNLAAANWTYTSQAANWKSSSKDSAQEEDKRDGDISEASQLAHKPSTSTSVNIVPSSSLSPETVQLTRKPSTGVAGSKFVESFDEER